MALNVIDPSLKLARWRIGSQYSLSDHTGERVLDTLKAVEVALGGAV